MGVQAAVAFAYHQRALEIRRRIDEKPGIANSLRSLGNIEAAMGRPTPALEDRIFSED